jgi:hypothetical protein
VLGVQSVIHALAAIVPLMAANVALIQAFHNASKIFLQFLIK